MSYFIFGVARMWIIGVLVVCAFWRVGNYLGIVEVVEGESC